MPLKKAYINPFLAKEGDTETFRAFRNLTTQLNRERARSARNYTIRLPTLGAPDKIVLIPRISRSHFALGRIIYCFSADMTYSATAYLTFTLSRHFTSAGSRVSRPIHSWGTNEVAPKAFDPYSVLVDKPMSPNDTLVLEIASTTGSPLSASLTVTVEEVFRQED